MYMEPDGAESSHSAARHENQEQHATQKSAPEHPDDHRTVEDEQPSSVPARVTIVAVRPVQTSIHVTSSESTSESTKLDSEEKSLETDSQNFFPSFAELFGNHRLPFTEHQQQQSQQRYRPSRFLGYFQRDRPYAIASSNKEQQPALLGSGNFGVIRGGTYYPEDKEQDEYSIDETAFSPFYHRGRTSYYKNPKPQPVRAGDFFANFRDFADITAPPKSSFSHLSVVYAAKNGSSTGTRAPDQPRNIFETLRMLEEEEGDVITTTTTEVPQKKLSQAKRKLIKMKKYQEDKLRKSRMTVEPLLALS
ncbi:uncharacterized protein LOC131674138 isoform X2 [Phymastichus coffea]|nr:uncharacterized protein LOC131674138 isoform X2 [Phymastichus coffea]XP_058808644.1 uncharacterized protein LOC131674138 isoform X2 [Phymastichus coffea]XP_058808645.1 uncharacterized protein LOC131674138 isoform X2 [Phymastichus coffea]